MDFNFIWKRKVHRYILNRIIKIQKCVDDRTLENWTEICIDEKVKVKCASMRKVKVKCASMRKVQFSSEINFRTTVLGLALIAFHSCKTFLCQTFWYFLQYYNDEFHNFLEPFDPSGLLSIYQVLPKQKPHFLFSNFISIHLH